MKKLLTICLMLLGAVAQAQNFAITATTEAAIRKNIVKGNAANYGFGMINDTLKLVGLTTRNVIFTGSTSKTDIGLGNVDNTSDANKPVSTATQTALNLKQNQLNGTGFIKATGTTISYDNSTYLSTSTAASTYLPISNPTAIGTLTAPAIANSLGANFATTSGNVGIGTASPSDKLTLNSAGSGTGFKIIGYQAENFINLNNSLSTGNRTFRLLAGITSVGYQGFSIYDNVAAETRFVINNNGNVGIGVTTDAGYKLDVNGTLRTVNDAYFATSSGNVGIGTSTPNASSVLDITSTTQGVLFPRLTTTQISAISSPADGLTVYNTTLKAICFYDAGAAVWKRVSHSNM